MQTALKFSIDRYLGEICRASLDDRSPAAPWLVPAFEDEGFFRAVDRNRLGRAMERAREQLDVSLSPQAKYRAAAAHAVVLQSNARVLATARHVVPSLEEAGVRFVLIKGVFWQKRLYGDFFERRSCDLDVYVVPEDYERAVRELRACGFEALEQCEARWWTASLGEQHFAHPDPRFCQVDLHHRFQQPGSPPPARPEAWVEQAQPMPLGGIDVPIPDDGHAALLSCMNLVKAVQHGEPAGMYLLEFAMAEARGRIEGSGLDRLARHQRLSGVVDFCRTARDRIMGPDSAEAADAPYKPTSDERSIDARSIGAALFATAGQRQFRHRDLLWALCAGEGRIAQVARFGRESVRYGVSEWRRTHSGGPDQGA